VSSIFVKLGTVCEINPRLPKNIDESQIVTFIPMASVSEDGVLLEQQYRTLTETKKGFTYFERGDVLLAKITPCFENGKAVFTNMLKTPVGFGSTEFHVLRPNHQKAIGKYIFYLIWNKSFRFHGQQAMQGAAGQKRISSDFLKNFTIPLPPLAEQQKIAAILDAADSLRQKDQQLVERYTALSQSLFLEMFGDPVTNPMGWEKVKLGEVCELQGGFSFKSSDFVQDGVKLVKIANVNYQTIDWAELDMLPVNYLDKYSNFSLSAGDILMALTRPIIKSLGTVKAVTVKKSDLPALLNQRVARFLPSEGKLNKQYLLRVIYSDYFKNKIDKYSSTSLQPNVSNKQVESIEILLPDINTQNQFAERIQLIEAQKQQAQASLEKSEALFNSLLQRAFTGELTAKMAA
jgi:type I restriction enzyme, S subunit